MSKKILDLRKSTGLSQVKFGNFYNIPLRTIQGWEEGQRECPVYVAELLERVVLGILQPASLKNLLSKLKILPNIFKPICRLKNL